MSLAFLLSDLLLRFACAIRADDATSRPVRAESEPRGAGARAASSITARTARLEIWNDRGADLDCGT
jgi:hypothetical protein